MIVPPHGGLGWTVTAMARIDRATKLLAQALAVLGLGALLCFAVMTMADGLLRFSSRVRSTLCVT
jgi:hypothetical protein